MGRLARALFYCLPNRALRGSGSRDESRWREINESHFSLKEYEK